MRYVDLGRMVENHKAKREIEAAQNNKKKGNASVFFLVLIVLIVVGLLFTGNVGALFDPLSIVSNIISPDLKETDGRTNMLILGVDKRSSGIEQSVLTDTLLFASIGRVEGNVAMISLPRDLWVKADAGKGSHFLKINAVYAIDGIEELVRITEEVLGVPIHYYAVVDFNLFRDAVDILGGVDVEVEREFDDFYYPIEGMENAPNIEDRYETIHFDMGLQTMDGETALRYVRSRKGTNNEGTDFARSKRQQNVITALKNKVLSLQTLIDLPKLNELYSAYSENVGTNIGLKEIQSFYLLSQQINFDLVRSIVLDDRSGAEQGGLLYSPTDDSLYGGAYVLIPKVGNFSQLHAYVQRYIFGE